MNGLGEKHGYVGQAIDPDWTPEAKPAPIISVPDCEAMLPLPPVGIYFGMPEEVYHRINACSTSELKRLGVSSMEAWAYSRRNPDWDEPVSKYLDHGKAVHCLVLEGEDAFWQRYAVQLDAADYPAESLLIGHDQIKAAIGSFTCLQPATPVQGTKQDLIDQLAALGKRDGVGVNLDGTVPELKARITTFDEVAPVKPLSWVEPDSGRRQATKADHIQQLLALDPDALVWDHIVGQHLAQHEGKIMLTAKDERRVRIAAHMIDRHPDAGPLLKGGYSEVSLFWHCPLTGVPMKARADKLKLHTIVDVKTFSNKSGKPIDRAIEHTIANYRYNLQQAIYDQGVRQVRKLIAEQGEAVIFSPDEPSEEEAAKRLEFCKRWAAAEQPPEFIFVFQQSGMAPVTRVKIMPREVVFSVTNRQAEKLKRLWAECVQTYGNDPWLDIEPMTTIDDESIPMWATEMGRDMAYE
jgi:hypothetical protein